MLDNSTIKIPNDTSHDGGAAPSTWGTYCGTTKPTVGRFMCTYCFRIIEANFPRYNKILDRINEAEGAIREHWKSPCCVRGIERIE